MTHGNSGLLDAPAGAALLLRDLLREQQELTAVEKFSQTHAHGAEPAQARYYRDLLPASAPKPGQQYAFEVDLDACTGCKACVTACHSLNGLDEDETWRSVGLLVGGTDRAPIFQTVTTACHHCAHPACMDGCPVKAFDKDLFTGIVKHLDDQCIGCQYCILKCPYDVPKYSAARGIVRKCDMCSSRLTAGEAPACVQACPSEAIRITVVDIAAQNDSQAFLAGCPDASYTRPTTLYKRARALPANTLSADDEVIAPEPAHWSLIVMLVLTQLSVGVFGVEALLQLSGGISLGTGLLAAAAGAGLAGMCCALLHLGRPLYAFRAILNLRTSWLSREVAAFGLFAPLALGALIAPVLAIAAACAGLLAVFCSAMIYIDTRRPFWAARLTLAKFFGTAAWLGCSLALLYTADGNASLRNVLCGTLCAISGLKLLHESLVVSHLDDEELTFLRKSARLLTGALRTAQTLRYIAGITGGLILPCALLTHNDGSVALAGTAFVLSLIGELAERYLFFRAAVPLKMPGGLPA